MMSETEGTSNPLEGYGDVVEGAASKEYVRECLDAFRHEMTAALRQSEMDVQRIISEYKDEANGIKSALQFHKGEVFRNIVITAIICVVTLFGLLWAAQQLGHNTMTQGYGQGVESHKNYDDIQNELDEIKALLKKDDEVELENGPN